MLFNLSKDKPERNTRIRSFHDLDSLLIGSIDHLNGEINIFGYNTSMKNKWNPITSQRITKKSISIKIRPDINRGRVDLSPDLVSLLNILLLQAAYDTIIKYSSQIVLIFLCLVQAEIRDSKNLKRKTASSFNVQYILFSFSFQLFLRYHSFHFFLLA